jgi:hypothetical protein
MRGHPDTAVGLPRSLQRRSRPRVTRSNELPNEVTRGSSCYWRHNNPFLNRAFAVAYNRGILTKR